MYQLFDIKIDVIFKEFFGDRTSKEILESFINTVLRLEGDKRIEVCHILNTRKMRTGVGLPETHVDISVKTVGGERYIVEMQTYNHYGFSKRLLYYLGRDYTEQIDYEMKGKKKIVNWRDLPKVHIIAVTDFHRCGKERDGLLNDKDVVETYEFSPKFSKKNDHLFEDQWRATIVDLKKFVDKPFKDLKLDSEKWFYLLKNSPHLKESEAAALKKEELFRQAIERLERLSADPKTRKAYEESINSIRSQEAMVSLAEDQAEERGQKKGEEIGRKKGEEIGRKKGEEMGRKKGEEMGRKGKAIEIAKAMLGNKIPVGQIASMTGLSENEIKALQK